MFKIAEALTSEGVAVIPHINSNHAQDWNWMAEFYQNHPELNTACMEFRTGNREKGRMIRKISFLKDMRDKIGRDLHVVVVGSCAAAREAKLYFPNITAMDATPCLKSIKRQMAELGEARQIKWRKEPLTRNVCMADYFEQNLNKYTRWVMKQIDYPHMEDNIQVLAGKSRKPLRDANLHIQSELPLDAA